MFLSENRLLSKHFSVSFWKWAAFHNTFTFLSGKRVHFTALSCFFLKLGCISEHIRVSFWKWVAYWSANNLIRLSPSVHTMNVGVLLHKSSKYIGKSFFSQISAPTGGFESKIFKGFRNSPCSTAFLFQEKMYWLWYVKINWKALNHPQALRL